MLFSDYGKDEIGDARPSNTVQKSPTYITAKENPEYFVEIQPKHTTSTVDKSDSFKPSGWIEFRPLRFRSQSSESNASDAETFSEYDKLNRKHNVAGQDTSESSV